VATRLGSEHIFWCAMAFIAPTQGCTRLLSVATRSSVGCAHTLRGRRSPEMAISLALAPGRADTTFEPAPTMRIGVRPLGSTL
jgi:hypothetical protein